MIFARHADVEVVIPGDEALMPNRAKSGAADQVGCNTQIVANRQNVLVHG